MSHLKGKKGWGKKRVEDSEDSDSNESDDGDEDEAGEEEEEEEEEQSGLKSFEGNREECKLVLVVRTDLGMGKGTTTPSLHSCLSPKSSQLKHT